MVNEFKNWLKQAEADIKTAENSLKSKDYYASAFWSQQATEKIIKSLLIKKKNRLIKIHDLVVLGRMAELPADLLEKVKLLSGIYTESRYGIIEDKIPAEKFKEKDASEFLNIAHEVLKWVGKKA